MRYQVPQFITIEDKIIGPFTLKQFLIYVGAIMLLVPVFITVPIPVFITIAIPLLGAAALFAHFKLHGRSLFTVIGSAFSFVARGQLYTWQRETGAKPLPVTGEEYTEYRATNNIRSLSDRARSLEAVGNVVNEDVEDEIDPDAAATAVTAGGGPSTQAKMQKANMPDPQAASTEMPEIKK